MRFLGLLATALLVCEASSAVAAPVVYSGTFSQYFSSDKKCDGIITTSPYEVTIYDAAEGDSRDNVVIAFSSTVDQAPLSGLMMDLRLVRTADHASVYTGSAADNAPQSYSLNEGSYGLDVLFFDFMAQLNSSAASCYARAQFVGFPKTSR